MDPSPDGTSFGFIDARHWWIAGGQTLLVSGDGGRTWTGTAVPLRELERLAGFSFGDLDHGWAAVSHGPATAALGRLRYLRTSDGGTTWVDAFLPPAP